MARTRSVLTLPSWDPAPDAASGSVPFVGDATVLIRCAGFTALTEPTFPGGTLLARPGRPVDRPADRS
jgi:hypothetical protein